MEALLQRWLEQEDEEDDDFLHKFRNYTLEAWDHRTHLRIAWLYLTREGRREGMKLIFEGIKSFIANSPRTARARGTTFHETMTYFWVHMVHYAMATTSNPDGSFKSFLLLNPQLANGGMFLAYYSKKLILHTPEARTSVILPDKAPLPSLISNVHMRAGSQEKASRVKPVTETDQTEPSTGARPAPGPPGDDTDFLIRFEGGQLDRWNHECLLRVIFLYLTTLGRAGGKDKVLAELKRHEGAGFHLTINYFWIQMVDFARASWQKTQQSAKPNAGAETGKQGLEESFENMRGRRAVDEGANFEMFRKWCLTSKVMREIVTDSRLYLRYYSKKIVFESSAAEEFKLPDMKPLPSLLD